MITNDRVRDIAVSLLKQESDRDKQKNVGASDFSDPCAYHVAQKLARIEEAPSKYWLGAKIGTAIHSHLEDAIYKADLQLLPELASAVIERKIFLGGLDDYGLIYSKPDLALVEDRHLIDWKTSSRDKVKKMQKVVFGEKEDAGTSYTLTKYYAQTQIYAWGLNRSGMPIDNCSLVFINRDGTTDGDVWAYSFPYDETYAEGVWARLVTIWELLRVDPENFDQFERHPECFKCKMSGELEKL